MKSSDLQVNSDSTQQITERLAAEILDERLGLYLQMVTDHPLFALAKAGKLPSPLLAELEKLQQAVDFDATQNAGQWTAFTKAQIAGWILVHEILLPALFAKSRDSQHSVQARREIVELIKSGVAVGEILAGMDFGMRAALDAPDALYAKAMRLARQ